MIALLWVIYGYSLAFAGPDRRRPVGLHRRFLEALPRAASTDSSQSATFSAGVELPELTFVVFQLTFAAITPALIIGAIAERMKFGAVMLFLAIWFTFSYLPMAHMVWGRRQRATCSASAPMTSPAVPWSTSMPVWPALVAAIVLGPRNGFMKEPIPPHNLTFTFIGACLLWVGWFGFNAGSNLEANGLAAQAVLNTITAPGRCGARLGPRRKVHPWPCLAARCGLGCGCRPRGHHPGGRPCRYRWARSSSAPLPAWSACGPS